MNPTLPPPGWYPSEHGYRWWTGADWGPMAPPMGFPQSEEEAGKTLATVAHIGSFAGGFLIPLVIYLMSNGKNRFARHHAAEALNFQITFIVVYLGAFIALFAGAAATLPNANGAGFPIAFVVVFIAIMGMMVANIVFGILGMVNASRGTWWRYPVRIPFVRA